MPRPLTRAPLRELSKVLFGNADRLEVAIAVARSPSGVVHAQALGQALGINPPRVRAQLLAFVAAGVMRQPPRVGQTVDYERIDGAFWEAVLLIAGEWE